MTRAQVETPNIQAMHVTQTSLNSFNAKQTLQVGDKSYTYYSLIEAEKNGLEGISRLPHSLKVVLENLLRFEDGRTVTKATLKLAPHG